MKVVVIIIVVIIVLAWLTSVGKSNTKNRYDRKKTKFTKKESVWAQQRKASYHGRIDAHWDKITKRPEKKLRRAVKSGSPKKIAKAQRKVNGLESLRAKEHGLAPSLMRSTRVSPRTGENTGGIRREGMHPFQSGNHGYRINESPQKRGIRWKKQK